MNGNGTIISAQPTSYFLARCKPCVRPVRTEVPNPPCPECGQVLRGERLFAVTRDESCDASCMGAVGPSCSCSCGGANHGKSFGAQSTREETERAVTAYRARVAREEEKRAKKEAATRTRAQRAFEAWSAAEPGRAELLAYLAEGPHDNDFVANMAREVAQLRPLTVRQEAAVGRCMEYARRRAQAQQRRGEEAATAAPVPTGKALEIEGEIVHARYDEADFGSAGRYKMLVRGEAGWRVWSTVPAALLRALGDGPARSFQGKRVRFTADVEVSPKDATYGFAKRPRKAAVA